MTRPPISVITAAQNASQRLADRHTPFVMNDWYVAAFGEEIKGQLLARTLLGRRLHGGKPCNCFARVIRKLVAIIRIRLPIR